MVGIDALGSRKQGGQGSDGGIGLLSATGQQDFTVGGLQIIALAQLGLIPQHAGNQCGEGESHARRQGDAAAPVNVFPQAKVEQKHGLASRWRAVCLCIDDNRSLQDAFRQADADLAGQFRISQHLPAPVGGDRQFGG